MANMQLDKKNKILLFFAGFVFIAALVVLIIALTVNLNQKNNPVVGESEPAASSDDAAATEIINVTQTDVDGKSYIVTETDIDGKYVPVTEVIVKNSGTSKTTSGDGDANATSAQTGSAGYANTSTTMYIPTLGEKTGDNICTDDPENKYIVAVAAKYKVDPELLVCIYPENYDGKETDNNFVLQFDGTKDENGKYIRRPDTLEYLYKVSADGDIIKQDDSGVYGKFIFSMVTGLMMPKHPDMFDGVS